MLARRTASCLTRGSRVPLTGKAKASVPAARSFSVAATRRGKYDLQPGEIAPKMVPFEEIKGPEDLLPPGAEPGTIPTDLEQSTGLERLEILGKMQGVDVFDMRPLPSDRRGTWENPIVVQSFGDERQCGCTGSPADSHIVRWCVISRDRPYERCDECGSVYKMDYVGPPPDDHHAHPIAYPEPKTMLDYVKEEYWYR